MTVSPERFLESVANDSLALANAARKGLDAPVPSCPGWTVNDVLIHLGGIHQQKVFVARERVSEREFEVTPPDGDPVDWFVDGSKKLVEALAATDAAEPCWTWFKPDQTMGFWFRRMAQETLIHRVDVELANGPVTDVPADIAEDGIDEALTVSIAGAPAWAEITSLDSAIKLDTGGRSWTLDNATWSGTTRSGRQVSDTPAVLLVDDDRDTDCTVRGSAPAIDLWLWGRGGTEELEITGDAALADRLRQVAASKT